MSSQPRCTPPAGGRHLIAVLGVVVLLAGIIGCGSAEPQGSLESTRGSQSPAITGSPEAPPDEPLGAGSLRAVECTRFVSPEGSDESPGTEDAPWATFAGAGLAAVPGDVVCFRAGTYLSQDVRLAVSGEADAPITFSAYPGEAVVLDAAGAGGVVVLAPDSSYLHLSGFDMVGFRIWGISLLGGNHHIRIDNMTAAGGEAGVRLTSGDSGREPEDGPVSHVALVDSRISGALYTGVDCTPGPCDDMLFSGLEIAGSGLTGEPYYGADGLGLERGQRVTVRNCVIHDNAGDGIDLNSRDWGGHVEGTVVEGNLIYRNHRQGIKLWAGGTMTDNQVWGQGIGPVMLGAYPGEFIVDHNTIAYNMWDASYSERDYSFIAGYPQDDGTAVLDLTLTNNIFALNGSEATKGPTGIYLGPGVRLVDSGGNLFFSRHDGEIAAQFVAGHDPTFTRGDIAAGIWAQYSGTTGDLVGDPRFTSGWPDVDLALLADSPARDAALNGSDTGVRPRAEA